MQRKLGQLLGTAVVGPSPAARGKKRTISAAGIARIKAAQRARWAAQKASKGAKKSRPKKRVFSAAARARLAAIAKARWAKAKAQGKKAL